ncbi:hypothetical protein M8C13_23720 [Crossiella sp. SN42]|uniref:hypothetical protein n=1 Tax=Crossiella sp. SN42 TaxID=2944808 RepID=UPI00207D5D24|nr:hypothetical protein [Crossiella sp. SN42]MCO1578766.1 hypothetical protein [Crossiella sp. SN42]
MGGDRADYLTGGLRPFTCPGCATVVLVKKNSPEHTSVQWTTATTACPELTGRDRPSAQVVGCPRLRAGIEAAVAEGRLAVGDG